MEKTRRTITIPVNPKIIGKPGSSEEIQGVMIYYYSEKEYVAPTDIAKIEELTEAGYRPAKYMHQPNGVQKFILRAKAEMCVTIGDKTYIGKLNDLVKEYNDEAEELSPFAFKKMAHAINKGRKKKDQHRALILDESLIVR